MNPLSPDCKVPLIRAKKQKVPLTRRIQGVIALVCNKPRQGSPTPLDPPLSGGRQEELLCGA